MSTEWNEDNIREHLFTVVDVSDNGIDWARTKLEGFRSKATYPFVAEGSGWVHMRLITKPKKRLMTIKELWGKTLMNECGSMMTICNSCDGNVVDSVDGEIIPIQELHVRGWKLADQYFDFKHSTSLMIEVDDE